MNKLVGVLTRFRQEEIAITCDVITKSQAMCAKAGPRLHKFASNSVEVLEAVAAEDCAKEIKDLDLRHVYVGNRIQAIFVNTRQFVNKIETRTRKQNLKCVSSIQRPDP